MEDRKYLITLIEPMLGGSPKNQRIYRDYVASKSPDPEVDGEEEVEMISEGQKGMTGFLGDPDGIYLMDYQVRGFLKESANILKESLGIKALRSKIDNLLFVYPRHIWLQEKPDGILERPLRCQTMQGPRVSLAASEFINAGLQLEITLTLLPSKEVTWEVVEKILDYGRLKGIGQWRNASYGRFTWERVPDEEVKPKKKAA